MALTKGFLGSGSEVDACAEIAQNAVREGSAIDLSAVYEATLGIQWALTSTTAHTGTQILVQTRHHGSSDEDWVNFGSPRIIGVGTATSEAVADNPLAAASTSMKVTVDTTGFTADGVLPVFMEDISTFANSEWLLLIGHDTVPTPDELDFLDGTVREHAQNSLLWSIAGHFTVTLPLSVAYARIVYDNTYDSDGSTVATRAILTKVTAVS